MKKRILVGMVSFLMLSQVTSAQDIAQTNVPAVIVNSFQKNFSKASDIDWEMDGTHYKVSFDIGWLGNDHEVWYDATGKMIKHIEEISSSNLPASVLSVIKKSFKGYRIDDPKKIWEQGAVSYKVELKSFTKDWNVLFAKDGKIIAKIED